MGAEMYAARLAAFAIAATALIAPLPAHAERATSDEILAQRRAENRRPTRLIVRPSARPLVRECVADYREIWRPEWRTYVITPGMRCWWAPG